ncbi:MAG TPA: hypothetical protein DCQ93_09540 [Bacteroidetes bacterium]|nr:hypothetical protein [Bacteroidota bacterium]
MHIELNIFFHRNKNFHASKSGLQSANSGILEGKALVDSEQLTVYSFVLFSPYQLKLFLFQKIS